MTRIRRLASEIRQRYGTRDPFALCDQMDIAVLFTDLPQITKGVFFTVHGKPIINLSLSLDERETRGVCAHELGHALLHPTSSYPFLSFNTNLVLGRYEREAEYFSACLLLDELDETEEDLTVEQLAAEHHLPIHVVQLWAQINAST